MSYGWINDDQILVFDGGKTTEQFTLISISQNTKRPVLQEINVQSNQRAQFAMSPDTNSLALALEKDGVWLIKKSLIEK